jgi:pimeloyl-ACP methyl ester carboxylesterase
MRRTLPLVLAAAGMWQAAACGRPAGEVAARGGAVAWESCEALPITDGRCGRVSVLENRGRPDGRAISLRVVVLPARDRPSLPDPVFYLAGGPGQAATVMLGDPSTSGGRLREHRDLVFLDQRGTGGSNGLDCQFYGPPADVQSYFDKFLPIDRVRACRAALSERADLAQYTTAASVEDLDEVRAALGYERINLVGGSYGTRLAMEYVRKHEASVRAVVLQSPVPPSEPIPERFGQMAQQSLDAVLDECAATDACARAYPKIGEEAREVLARLRGGPVTATVVHQATGVATEVRVTHENIAESIRYMTYVAGQASAVPSVLHQAYKGNFSPIAQDLLRRRADGTFDGLYLSITCAEDVPFVRASAAEDDDRTYLTGYRVREQRAACAEWPRGEAPSWRGQPVTSDRPVLIVTGTLDPVTPVEFADLIARTLPNSVQLRIPHAGHSPAGLTGLGCLSDAIADFIESGRTGAVQTGCVSDITRPGFVLPR